MDNRVQYRYILGEPVLAGQQLGVRLDGKLGRRRRDGVCFGVAGMNLEPGEIIVDSQTGVARAV